MFRIAFLGGILLSRTGIKAIRFPDAWACGDVGVTCIDSRVSRIDYLSNLNLSGTIPSTIGLLTDLTFLSIRGGSNNSLTGTLPSEMGNLVNLKNLSLKDINLSGAIPTSFKNLVNIVGIRVRGSHFCGGIPLGLRLVCPLKTCFTGVVSNSPCPSVAPSSSAPSKVPSAAPSRVPSAAPSKKPSAAPSKVPSAAPSKVPSAAPSKVPSPAPSKVPSAAPSKVPSAAPSKVPSAAPSRVPSAAPSRVPSAAPSRVPSAAPSKVPSAAPSKVPSAAPSEVPSSTPSAPTVMPSQVPSAVPSTAPSAAPSEVPSASPSAPTFSPSNVPSASPSEVPSSTPSAPTVMPSQVPSAAPTIAPSAAPTKVPSTSPTKVPSAGPSRVPSSTPSAPTAMPSQAPSATPSTAPSAAPSRIPTSAAPSKVPSAAPSKVPSAAPSKAPSAAPSKVPSAAPSKVPSAAPSKVPSAAPSRVPSAAPSRVPSAAPSRKPSKAPSAARSKAPSVRRTRAPIVAPSKFPSAGPSKAPSAAPSSVLSSAPSKVPSSGPFRAPSSSPSKIPSASPSVSKQPTATPTATKQPSASVQLSPPPTSNPSRNPSFAFATKTPSARPSAKSSVSPSVIASVNPSRVPSRSPSATASLKSAKPTAPIAADSKATTWTSQGGSIYNTRHVDASATRITRDNLKLQTPSYFWNTGGSVQVSPGINGDYVIFPTSKSGTLSAYNNTNGVLIWNKTLGASDYASGPYSRSTPAFWRDFFFVGTYGSKFIHKIRTSDGEHMGSVAVHSHPQTIVLCSGVVYKDSYLIGVGSQESNTGGNDTYQCCSFAGRFHSINALTMAIQWTWHSIPPELTGPKSQNKWSGAAIWGSSPSIHEEAGLVFLSTGNNYNENAISNACYAKWPISSWEVECNQKINPENWFDSVVALDITTGKKVWARRFEPQDGWNAGCLFTTADTKVNCPKAPFRGPDFDFGMAPAVSTFGPGGGKVLYIGQKRGMVYCINSTTGTVIWATNSSPGGRYGGHSWGIAVDDVNVYLSTINKDQNPWPLVNGTIAYGGGWTALNKITGKQIWTTTNPAYYDNSGNDRKRSSWGLAPPLSIGDFLLVGSADDININTGGGGSVYMLDKTTGNILQSFETGASVFSGFSADHRCVYVGSGGDILRNLAVGKGAYAWCV